MLLLSALSVLKVSAAQKVAAPTEGSSVEITTAMKDQALVQPNSEAYEKAVGRLRQEGTKVYDFDRAILADVLRALATDAGLDYLALPESQEADATPRQHPFEPIPFHGAGNGGQCLWRGPDL